MGVTRYYHWLSCRDEDGKPYLVYGGQTEDEARQKGLELLGGIDFQIKRLPTRDLATASSFLKGHRLEKYHSLKKASKRLGHDKSLNRMRHRRTSGTSNIF